MKVSKMMLSVIGVLAFVGMFSVGSASAVSIEEGGIEMIGYGGDAPACTLQATPSTIEVGGGTNLEWDVNESVTKAYLHPKGSTSWMQEVSLDGAWWISGIMNSRDYTLTVESADGQTADCDTHVNVEEGTTEELTCDMYANPSTIMENGGTNLVWNSTGDVVTAKLHPTGSTSYFADVSSDGSWWISGITNSRSYSVTLWDVDGNSVTCDAPIIVEENVVSEEEAPSCEMHANPEAIDAGGMTTLIWHNSANTVKASIEGIGEVSADTGWYWMNGVTNTSFTMTVENASGDTATCVANVDMGV